MRTTQQLLGGTPASTALALAASLLLLLALLAVPTRAALETNASARHTLPRPHPLYTKEERAMLRRHFQHFLHLKSAEPLVHTLPGTGILFEILSPAPWHLGRHCGAGGMENGAVEAEIIIEGLFGERTLQSGTPEGTVLYDLQRDAQLLRGEKAVLARIPENEVWRVYFPGAMGQRQYDVAADDYGSVVTEVITVKKVWANRLKREMCRQLLSDELGYDPYVRDAVVRQEQPDLAAGVQASTYPLPGEEVT